MELGHIRCKSADKQPASIIISVSFPYQPEDIPFTEELLERKNLFRSDIAEYFATKTLRQLGAKTDRLFPKTLSL
jgi:flagellar basal body-associated protein FliL